jgi:hypothetical protein
MNDTRKNRWAEIWQAECERAAFHAAAMLRVGRIYPSPTAILELIRSAPCRRMKNRTRLHPRSCVYARAARKFARPYDQDLLESICDYFCYLAAMKPARRAFLEASLAGVLIGAE